MHAESGAAAVQRLVHWHWKLVVIISSGGARRVPDVDVDQRRKKR